MVNRLSYHGIDIFEKRLRLYIYDLDDESYCEFSWLDSDHFKVPYAFYTATGEAKEVYMDETGVDCTKEEATQTLYEKEFKADEGGLKYIVRCYDKTFYSPYTIRIKPFKEGAKR